MRFRFGYKNSLRFLDLRQPIILSVNHRWQSRQNQQSWRKLMVPILIRIALWFLGTVSSIESRVRCWRLRLDRPRILRDTYIRHLSLFSWSISHRLTSCGACAHLVGLEWMCLSGGSLTLVFWPFCRQRAAVVSCC